MKAFSFATVAAALLSVSAYIFAGSNAAHDPDPDADPDLKRDPD
jgi:hypothetical protein